MQQLYFQVHCPCYCIADNNLFSIDFNSRVNQGRSESKQYFREIIDYELTYTVVGICFAYLLDPKPRHEVVVIVFVVIVVVVVVDIVRALVKTNYISIPTDTEQIAFSVILTPTLALFSVNFANLKRKGKYSKAITSLSRQRKALNVLHTTISFYSVNDEYAH